MAPVAPPRILLAEDDPVSRTFLLEALRQLGCTVSPAADGEEALACARAQAFDLLIVDRSLPRLHGDLMLRGLRSDRDAASRATPAIAATADPDAATHAALLAAGFVRVLVKPLTAASLRRALLEAGLRLELAATETLDDAAGLAASGNAQTLHALRGLFAAELESLQGGFVALRGDRVALRERLHRLRAACGFCGASALQRAAVALSDASAESDPSHSARLESDFLRTLGATLEALRRGTT